MLDPTTTALRQSDAGSESFEAVECVEWHVGRHTLMRADCEIALAELDPSSIDVVVTSPPYNLGIRYSGYADDRPMTDYLAWLGRIAKQLQRCLKDDGSIFLNVSGSSTNPWVAMDVAQCFRKYFTLQNNIAWIKSISIGEETRGHFKPIRSGRFLNHNHESVFHFTKSGNVSVDRLAVGVPFQDKSNIARRGHVADRRCAGDTWFIPYETIQDKSQRYHHPAAFPEELVRKCLKLHSGRDLHVLDPFVGTGTTLVAAQSLGHRSTGIDLDPAYIAVARDRLAERCG